MKKLCVFLALILIFSSFVSCSVKKPSSNESGSDITSSEIEINNEEQKVFSLPFFAGDSFNPYSATQSTNFYLGTLLYDSLFILDNNFKPQPLVAKEYTFEENEIRIKIKSGLKFSDGSEIILNDISSSLASAISSRYFGARLSNISSYSVKGDEFVIKLKEPNKDFIKNLNFPIIKNGSKESRAIGSGRYCFSEENDQKLVKNSYSTRKTSDIESISLVEIHKYSTLPHMIKIGSINFAYTDTTDITTAATKTSPVQTNNLVYVGVNSSNPMLANQDFRKAISLCINRKNILTDAFAGAGNATAQPFNPVSSSHSSENYKISLTDINAAKELFAVVGLTAKDENGIFKTNDEKPVSLRLAVNSDSASKVRTAEYIKLNLQAQGIAVQIISENAEAYKNRISNKDYDLFIGEVKLTPDNNISPLLSLGALNACDDMSETLLSYKNYLSGTTALDDFLRTFDIKTPFIPILYKNSLAVYSGTLSENTTTNEYDVFAGMENWKF